MNTFGAMSMLKTIPIVLTLGVALITTGSAAADEYARTYHPYWRVGTLDRELSAACRKMRFNQVYAHRTHIGFHGDDGPAITGVATKEWNLRDPQRLAVKGLTYHFYNDGFSNCKVFVAGTPAPR